MKSKRYLISLSTIGIILICLIFWLIPIITPILSKEYKVWNPVTSPNNQYVAFRCFFVSLKNVVEYQWEIEDRDYFLYYHGDVCVINLGGINFHRLTSGGQVSNPVWSPDNESLAWLYGKSNAVEDWKSIRIWNKTTLEIADLPLPAITDSFVDTIVWSADGKKILLQGIGGIINVITGEYTPLPQQDIQGKAFSFWRSNDENHIIYKEYLNWPDLASGRIVIVSETGDPVFLKKNTPAGFSVSPDGELLAFPDRLNASSFQYDAIIVVHLPTGKSIVYEPGDSFGYGAETWELEGTKLVFNHSSYIRVLAIQRNKNGEPVSIVEENRIQYCGTIIKEDCRSIDGGMALIADGHELIVGIDYKLWVIRIDDQEGYQLQIE